MNEGRGMSLQIRLFYKKAKIPLGLHLASGQIGFSKTVRMPAKAGDSMPVLLWGKKEIQKIQRMTAKQRADHVREELLNVPCVILCDGLPFPPAVKQCARDRKIALFSTDLSKAKCKATLNRIFPSLAISQHVLSGGLLKIYGAGVLIMGDSGVGKSESALELISRGHKFISDDVVQIRKDTKGHLIGSAMPISRNFMEIRGLGIINIQKIFGKESTLSKTKIDLIIMLKRWKAGKEYDRLGLRYPENWPILGVAVPKISIPVAPGRNIAALIEVACKVHLLKQAGYHAAQEITQKLDRALASRSV